ncbi:hypothetical protein D3C76_1037180 [compost metagenome]
MAPPITVNIEPSRLAAAMIILTPVITGHAICPIPPSTPTSASAPATTLKRVWVSSGFALIQVEILLSQAFADVVRRRSADSSCAKTLILRPFHVDCSFVKSPSRLSVLMLAIRAVLPFAS